MLRERKRERGRRGREVARKQRGWTRQRDYQDNQFHLVPYIFDSAETKC